MPAEPAAPPNTFHEEASSARPERRSLLLALLDGRFGTPRHRTGTAVRAASERVGRRS